MPRLLALFALAATLAHAQDFHWTSLGGESSEIELPAHKQEARAADPDFHWNSIAGDSVPIALPPRSGTAGVKRAAAPQHIPLRARRGAPGVGREMLKRKVAARKRQTSTGSSVTPQAVGTNLGEAEVNMLNSHRDLLYVADVQIGTPAQTLGVHVDTGSSLLWVATTECNTGDCAKLKAHYNPKASSTWLTTGKAYRIPYLKGETDYELGADTVSFGGQTIRNQYIGAAFDATEIKSYIDGGASGIAGFSIGERGPSQPFWQTLAEQAWADPEFGMYLAREVDQMQSIYISSASVEQEAKGGQITLGGVDESLIDGSLTYVDVADATSGHWEIPVEGMTVNGKRIGSSGVATLDSGTSWTVLPQSVVTAFYAAIPGSKPGSVTEMGSEGYFYVPCAGALNAEVTIGFGGQQFPIYGADLIAGDLENGDGMCLGTIMYLPADPASSGSLNMDTLWLLGATIMKNIYTAHRLSPGPAVGLGRLTAAANKKFTADQLCKDVKVCGSQLTAETGNGGTGSTTTPGAGGSGLGDGGSNSTSSGTSGGTSGGSGTGSGAASGAVKVGVSGAAVAAAIIAAMV